MDISEIRDRYYAGRYTAESSNILAHVSESHIFDEDLSVKRNRELAIEHNNRRAELIKERNIKQNELFQQLTNDVVDYIVDNYELNRQQARIVERFIYREKHYYMNDYFEAVDEYSEFAEFLVNVEESNQ
jgi:hypothetical protein